MSSFMVYPKSSTEEFASVDLRHHIVTQHNGDVVPLVIDGLADDSGLQDEVLTLLKDGAHLLRG